MAAASVALPAPRATRSRPSGLLFLSSFAAAAVGFGAARALATTYLPVLLERIEDAPILIGVVMLVNAASGFAVPLVAGVVVDRREPGRLGRRGGLLLIGAAITAGGLLATATGTESSYLLLTLTAAAIYTGLNVATTAHRAVVADAFGYDERPRVTSAQELAALAGGLVGTVTGGVLIDASAPTAFAIIAVVVLLGAVPTLRLRTVREAGATIEADERPARRQLAEIARLPGAREVLAAQVLWVIAYAALPTFLILYADDQLGLATAPASALVVAFGALTGVGTLVAGRLRGDGVQRGLMVGVAMLGLGGLAVVPAGSLAAAAVPFGAVAFGAGMATALGYPYFTRFVGRQQAGRAAGVFFSVRSIGSAIALPLAGGVAQVGGYRWIWVLGAGGLAALLPLSIAARLGRRAVGATAVPRPPLRTVGVIVPYLASERVEEIARRAAAQPGVAAVVVVDDGAPLALGAGADALAAAEPHILSVRPGRHQGKGGAVASGLLALRDALPDMDAVAVVDSDGQHPPERLPAFLDAARDADVVIGARVDRAGAMPAARRLANAASSAALSLVARRRLPDTQNGMRLYRVDALDRVPLADGGYDAETRHLKALLTARQAVAWVPIPTIYNGEPSGFRPVVDSVRVLRAILARPLLPAAPSRSLLAPLASHLRVWWPRLGLTVALGWLIAALLPVLQPIDERLFLSINHLGDGPGWLYDAVDPHARNYVLLTALTAVAAAIAYRRVRFALGAALAVVVAGFGSDMVMELVRFWTDRERPEEVLGADAWLSHARSWGHIASYPSGHLVVTTAMASAAILAVPWLRWPLVPYVGVIAATRVLFGAHFPIDVAVGTAIGLVSGLFFAGLLRSVRLLPATPGLRSERAGGLLGPSAATGAAPAASRR